MKIKLYLLLSLVFITQIVVAQNLDQIVQGAVKKFQAAGTTVGFSIGIIDNGKSNSYHFGSTEKGKYSPPNDSTIYEIGSITKTFTSLLLAQAVIERRVLLQSEVSANLSEKYPNLAFNGEPLKLVHLANLTSGLPNNLPEKLPTLLSTGADSQLFEIQKFHEGYTKHQFLNDLHDVKLTQKPGLAIAHSNTASQLLGFALEDLYRLPYRTLLQKYVTKPFNMASTDVEYHESKQRYYSHGYNDKGTLMPTIPQDAGAAGVIRSTVHDMLNYLKYEMDSKNEAIQLTHRATWGDPGDIAVGLNWMLKNNFDGYRKIWASGGPFGQSSYICFYPKRKFAIVILSNESDGGAEDRLSELAQDVYNGRYFTAEQRSSEGFSFSFAINRLLDSLKKTEFKGLILHYAAIKKADQKFKIYENEVNSWGYYYFFKNQKEKALEIFKLNAWLYPLRSNVYDSLAETYEEMGDKNNAIKNYEKELQLNPNNHDISDHLKKLKVQQ